MKLTTLLLTLGLSLAGISAAVAQPGDSPNADRGSDASPSGPSKEFVGGNAIDVIASK